MSRSPIVAALPMLVALTLAGTACGEGFDREAAVDSFRQANPEVTDAQATCVVDRQIDRFGLDGLAAELETDPPTDEFVDIQFRDMFACGIDGDVEEQLIQQLEPSGVPTDAAPCVADRIVDQLGDEDIDVLVSGDITEDFMTKFIAAMEGCGAVTSGSGG